jgi:K+-transporting ATPase KdpF subunit
MNLVYAIGSVLAAILLIFLLYKLCRPEDAP